MQPWKSPIIYALVGILAGGLIFGVIAVLSDSGFPLSGNGTVEVPLALILIGGPIFWWGSKEITQRENLQHPRWFDHLRQSSLYYLLLVFWLLQVDFSSFSPYGDPIAGLFAAYVIGQVSLCLWAIVVNALFLWTKSNVKQYPQT